MAEQVAKMVERSIAPRRRIERAIVMHGTSAYRETAARILVQLLDATAGDGVAFGWTDVLAPGLLAPVHVVTRRPGLSWELAPPSSHRETIDRSQPVDRSELLDCCDPVEGSEPLDRSRRVDHPEQVDLRVRIACSDPVDGSGARHSSGRLEPPDAGDSGSSLEWTLVVKGASRERIPRAGPLLEYAKGYFAHTRSRDVSVAPDAETAFVELLGALGFCGFRVAETAAAAIATAFRDKIGGLPESACDAAEEVASALRDPRRLQGAVSRLGSDLDVAGAFVDAAVVHLTGYELALQRGDGTAGIDAARSAGRAFRRMGDLGSSLRWYELAAGIAEVEEDRGRLALALDGAGNTHRHRGSFPRAREAYEAAWDHAVASGDGTAIGNVAHSMMTVERWAGNVAAASIYALASLKQRQGPDARARALINLGSLLREGRDLENAELAFSLAKRESTDGGIRAFATDALAYCAALRGDGVRYARWRAEVRDARIREPFLRAQIGYFRALSLSALGRLRQARRLLGAVERYSRSWGLAQWEVKAAETELPLPQGSPMDTPNEVRQGLQALQVAST